MLRSMFSAISGLRAHQTMMDVVGNNIANVNTTGYKNSRATFQESLTQVIRGATSASAAAGGTGPMQIGLGARIAATDTSFSQGATQVTGRSTDIAIQGDGFFAVESGGALYFERAGAFNTDADGNLVGPNGEFLLGSMATTPGPTATVADPVPSTPGPPPIYAAGDFDVIQIDLDTYTDPQIGQDGTVTAREIATGELHVVGKISLARFNNNNGLQKIGSGLYSPTPNSGVADIGWPADGARGFLQSGTLEMSNVDLAAEFTNMIIAQRGFQANSRTITTSDEILQELVNLKR